MRFAGTWKQYSKKAIPQLARTTFQSASPRNFKWPYHAKVMKILDTMSNRIVRIRKGAPCTVPRYRLETRKDSPKLLSRLNAVACYLKWVYTADKKSPKKRAMRFCPLKCWKKSWPSPQRFVELSSAFRLPRF